MRKKKKKILITDDSEINRSILSDMLEDEFTIIEAEDGVQAVSALKKYGDEISLVLLDIVMPKMDGFEVLAVMNKNRWIEDIPVIMITAENTPSYVERAYDLGITDFISRPFDGRIVHRRAVNTIMLYSKQKKLTGLIAEQIYDKQKQSNLMIEILSNIVEFRNGESGLHVLHIHVLTELLLNSLIKKTDRYSLGREDINLIGIASALHDIGKIAIPEDILNKPARLTRDEFEIVKTHSAVGGDMLKDLPFRQNEPLVQVAYQICRWHHERYDGSGYPDGLKGDDIPIAAQAVSLADVYDALVSKRVYKEAYTHEKAIEMILDGQCGVFNPLLIECLLEIAPNIERELKISSLSNPNRVEISKIKDELVKHDELHASERTLLLLEHERTKYNFFASMSKEVQFEYTVSPPMLTLSEFGVKELGLPEIIVNPLADPDLKALFPESNLKVICVMLNKTTPQNPITQRDFQTCINGEKRWHRIIARSMWAGEESNEYVGAIGKMVDITDEKTKLTNLEQLAYHDSVTGLLNQNYADSKISEILDENQENEHAMIIVDIDHFKNINDAKGHLYGNTILKYVADIITQHLNEGEIAARIGGDEFLVFVQAGESIYNRVEELFKDVLNNEQYKVSVSMGIALGKSEKVSKETLFHQADRALYAAKRDGRGKYAFYNSKMKNMFNEFTPIENESKDN